MSAHNRSLSMVRRVGMAVVVLGIAGSTVSLIGRSAWSQPPRSEEKSAADAERRERELLERERAEREQSERQRQRGKREERRGELPSLDELTEMAMDRSIERRLAILRIEQAELELKQVEREIATHVAELHRAIRVGEIAKGQARHGIELGERRLRQLREAAERNPESREALAEAEHELHAMHLRLAEAEAEQEQARHRLHLLLQPRDEDEGERDDEEDEDEMHFHERVLERIPEDVRRGLAARTSVDFIETPLSDAMAFLQDQHRIKIVVDDGPRGELSRRTISLSLQNTSLAAVLQAISDVVDDAHVYVRDYGLLVSRNPEQEGLELEDYLEISR